MLRYDITPGASALHQTAVEVEIWEGYFLKSKSGIAKTLYTYSLDNGPFLETANGGLVFHFTTFDWQKNIKDLLAQNNIHGEVIQKFEINPLKQLLKKKIFLADDDREAAFCLSKILEDAGYQVRVATDGKGIVDGTYSWVDLFILDKKMPDIDGLAICHHLRNQAATKDTPVIMISALPQSGNEALLAGANAYIEKPFHVHYFLNIISKYTGNKGEKF